MIVCTLSGLLLLASVSSQLAGPVPARIDRVIDGDTVRVSADVWIDQAVSVSVRIADIDAPELFRPKCPLEKEKAREAKLFVSRFVAGGGVSLYDIRRGKYAGRVVARIENSRGEDLGAALTAANHAIYGSRGQWCG